MLCHRNQEVEYDICVCRSNWMPFENSSCLPMYCVIFLVLVFIKWSFPYSHCTDLSRNNFVFFFLTCVNACVSSAHESPRNKLWRYNYFEMWNRETYREWVRNRERDSNWSTGSDQARSIPDWFESYVLFRIRSPLLFPRWIDSVLTRARFFFSSVCV